MPMSDKGGRAAAVAIVAAVASLGLAGTAAAATVPPTLTVNQACYVTVSKKDRPTMVVTGTGYGPGDSVSVSDSEGGFYENTTADASGAITVSAPAPVPYLDKPGEKSDTITATDYSPAGPVYVGTATTKLSELIVAAKSRRGRGLSALTRKTRWAFSGFPEGKEIWGHYLYRHKLLARQKFGRAKGPCGLLTTRARMYPATPHHRVYQIQLDSSRHYSTHTSPRLVTKIGLQLFF